MAYEFLTASAFNALKSRVDAEVTRRNNYNAINFNTLKAMGFYNAI